MRLYTDYIDDQLLLLLAKSDDRAFTEVYNRYWDKLLYLAALKTGSMALAEEIVQDIFTDLWSRRESLSIEKSLEAYLAVSVKYRVINAQVKMKRASEYKNFVLNRKESSDLSTEQLLNFRELEEKLSELVSKLPERCRLTWQLSREEGLSQKEVANCLQVSEKAVEANLARAMKTLRLNLKQFFSFFI